MSLDHMPANPSYGSGAYRRRLRFVVRQFGTLAVLDDTHHAMWLTIAHRDGVIEQVRADFNRHPATPCHGAVASLSALHGMRMDAAGSDVTRALSTQQSCTHLGDLARWSLMVSRGPTPSQSQYDIIVPDTVDGPAWIEISRDGDVLHRWLVRDQHIVGAPFAGLPLMRGFMAWAREAFSGDALESALMLQRGVFVARARPFLVDHVPPVPLRAARGMEGACFSYSGENWRTGTSMTGYVRDFTDHLTPLTLPPAVADAFGLDLT